MNKKTVKTVERRILKAMMEDERQLRVLLETETENIHEEQLDGLMVKIEQLLGRIMVNQNKLMLFQDLV
jgi:DNA-directed RNA polymerase subunit F